MEMTKYDVKNYLEKIYNIPVVEVRTRIAMGRTKRDLKVGYVTKEDDTKYAYVTMVIPLMLYIYLFQNHYYTTFPERLAQGAQIHFPRYIPGRSQATAGRRRQSAWPEQGTLQAVPGTEQRSSWHTRMVFVVEDYIKIINMF